MPTTVAQLIEALKKMPKDAHVKCLKSYDDGELTVGFGNVDLDFYKTRNIGDSVDTIYIDAK